MKISFLVIFQVLLAVANQADSAIVKSTNNQEKEVLLQECEPAFVAFWATPRVTTITVQIVADQLVYGHYEIAVNKWSQWRFIVVTREYLMVGNSRELVNPPIDKVKGWSLVVTSDYTVRWDTERYSNLSPECPQTNAKEIECPGTSKGYITLVVISCILFIASVVFFLYHLKLKKQLDEATNPDRQLYDDVQQEQQQEVQDVEQAPEDRGVDNIALRDHVYEELN